MRSRGCALAYRAPDVEGRASECRPSTLHPLCRDQPETEVRRCGRKCHYHALDDGKPRHRPTCPGALREGSRYRGGDFEVVLLNAGQLGCYYDPVLMSEHIDLRESGLWRSRALRKPVNLLLQKPHVAEWTAVEHVCDHGHVTPVEAISFRPCLASAASRLSRFTP